MLITSASKRTNLGLLANTQYDLPAGLVVFLVALPLCLGIALASKAPLSSGIIAGIVGGIVIPLFSRSALSVSGPAAGLTAVVVLGIDRLAEMAKASPALIGHPEWAGNEELLAKAAADGEFLKYAFGGFLVATVLAGLMQIGLGAARAGGLGELVPSSVIKGMLAAIGIILILKQIPHAVGYDAANFASVAFDANEAENTFTLFWHALFRLQWGAVIISAVSLVILFGWERTPLKNVTFLPSALVVVVLGVVLNQSFRQFAPDLYLDTTHLVDLGLSEGGTFFGSLPTPEWSFIGRSYIFELAVTIALVASIETLLCVEAVDRLDPFRRRTPTSRELVAQGIGNTVSGLIGGLPVTSVIVRSSANVSSGGRTRMAAIYHGVFLLLAMVFLTQLLTLIPLACLAAILLQVGYKLARPRLLRTMFRYGPDQFVPFMVTIVAIILTDLLKGVVIGLIIGIIYVLRHKTNAAFSVARRPGRVAIKFNKDVSFIHKPALVTVLRDIPDNTEVIIDGTPAEFIDFDIKEAIQQFEAGAPFRGIQPDIRGIRFRAEADGTPRKRERRPINPVLDHDGSPSELLDLKDSDRAA